MTNKITAGTAVLVENLERFAEANTRSLLDIEPSWTPPLIFCKTHVENRRLGATGVVQRQSPGHYGFGAWVVRHDDGTEAVYHTTEFAGAKTASAVVAPPAESVPVVHDSSQPKLSANIRGCVVEVYVNTPAVMLSGDVLIAALAAGKPREEQLEARTHHAIRSVCGSEFHDVLATVGELDPLQTVVIGHPVAHKKPQFGAVLFINGGQPTMDAVDMALSVAQDFGAATVILPISDFVVCGPADTIEPEDVIEFFDVLLESSSTQFKKLKVVI
jgi:hypothetical protein